jgi:hypothetical protein
MLKPTRRVPDASGGAVSEGAAMGRDRVCGDVLRVRGAGWES